MPYFFYVIRSNADGSYYKGQTQDLNDRLERHNQGRSSFTRGKAPWRLVYSETYGTRGEAAKREASFKSPKGWQDWRVLKKKIESEFTLSERGAAR